MNLEIKRGADARLLVVQILVDQRQALPKPFFGIGYHELPHMSPTLRFSCSSQSTEVWAGRVPSRVLAAEDKVCFCYWFVFPAGKWSNVPGKPLPLWKANAAVSAVFPLWGGPPSSANAKANAARVTRMCPRKTDDTGVPESWYNSMREVVLGEWTECFLRHSQWSWFRMRFCGRAYNC